MTASRRDSRFHGRPLRRTALAVTLLAGAVGFAAIPGCSDGAQGSQAVEAREIAHAQIRAARAQMQAQEDAARASLDTILPPSKSLYLSVNDRRDYRNPFLIINPDTVTVMVVIPSETPRPAAAKGSMRADPPRRKIEVPTAELAATLASLPSYAWPYGRVAAVEEAPGTREQKIKIRRNVESAYNVLNDIGVVVDEWSSSTGSETR